jgi:hypothetical protein
MWSRAFLRRRKRVPRRVKMRAAASNTEKKADPSSAKKHGFGMTMNLGKIGIYGR